MVNLKKGSKQCVVGADNIGHHDDSIFSGSISGVVLFVEGGVTVAVQSSSKMPVVSPSPRDCSGSLGRSLGSTDSLTVFSTTALAAAVECFVSLSTVTGTLATEFFFTSTVGVVAAGLVPLIAWINTLDGVSSFALALTLVALIGLVAGGFAANTDAEPLDFAMAVTVLLGLIVAVVVTFDLTSSGQATFTLDAAIFAAAAAIGPP